MIKRAVAAAGVLAVTLGLMTGLATWIVLARWVPTNGKAYLKQALERSGAVEASIGAIRYEWFRGFVIEEIRLVDRRSRALWFATPAMSVRPHWGRLFLGQAALHSRTPVEVPCRTTLTLSGRYHLWTKRLEVEAQTTEIPLQTISPPLSASLPPALTDGMVRASIRLTQQAQGAPTIFIRLAGTRLVWTAAASASPTPSPRWRLTGDAAFEGHLAPTTRNAPWAVEGLVSMRQGTLEESPLGHPITDLQGTAWYSGEQLEIRRLTGTALDSPWRLEGVAQLAYPYRIDALLVSLVDLRKAGTAVPAVASDWGPVGTSSLSIGCRGPLQPSPFLDCLAHAAPHDVTLSPPQWTTPLTHVSGALEYDHLAGRLVITQLRGRLLEDSVELHGEASTRPPVTLSLGLRGTVPLEALGGWLPALHSPDSLGGKATVDLEAIGPLDGLRYTGWVDFLDGRVRLTARSTTLSGLTGRVVLTDDTIGFQQLSLRLNDLPLTVSGSIGALQPGPPSAWREHARFEITIASPHGQLSLAGETGEREIAIREGLLSLERSRVGLRGTLSRAPESPSVLSLSGMVDLAELQRLPGLGTPLTPWNLRGLAEVDARVQGRLAQWPAVTVKGNLRADAVTIREIPIEQISCQFAQDARSLRLHVPGALLAGGNLVGELAVERRAEGKDSFLLQTDLTGAQLERMAQAVPAWRSRGVTGTASGHLVLSGTWQERVTWRGEGWLNATGQRLGNVPLLDRLFQGGIVEPLAGWLGLDPLRRVEITQASMRWRLADERMRTEDLRLVGLVGEAAVVFYVGGSVGLDQTVDVDVQPELSEQVILQSRVIQGATSVLKSAGLADRFFNVIRYRVTGTLRNPKPQFEFPTPQELLNRLLGSSPGDLFQGLLKRLQR